MLLKKIRKLKEYSINKGNYETLICVYEDIKKELDRIVETSKSISKEGLIMRVKEKLNKINEKIDKYKEEKNWTAGKISEIEETIYEIVGSMYD